MSNLRPDNQWKKGQSGNPKGRPKTTKFSEACREIAAEIDPRSGETRAQALARKCYERAMKDRGDTKSAEIFLHYCEGRPPQSITLSGALTLTHEERAKSLFDKLKSTKGAE